jgi:hypothetical protein
MRPANPAQILQPDASTELTGKYKYFVNALKQIFLFLPGTFFLYFVGFVAAIIFMDIFFHQRPLADLPPSAPFQIALLGIIGIGGSFMTWFGLGDLKNTRHRAIPASILATGAMIGIIVKALENISEFAVGLLRDFDGLMYLFPLVLIIPVLTKGWVDRKAE